jgi:hypothetical protein
VEDKNAPFLAASYFLRVAADFRVYRLVRRNSELGPAASLQRDRTIGFGPGRKGWARFKIQSMHKERAADSRQSCSTVVNIRKQRQSEMRSRHRWRWTTELLRSSNLSPDGGRRQKIQHTRRSINLKIIRRVPGAERPKPRRFGASLLGRITGGGSAWGRKSDVAGHSRRVRSSPIIRHWAALVG